MERRRFTDKAKTGLGFVLVVGLPLFAGLEVRRALIERTFHPRYSHHLLTAADHPIGFWTHVVLLGVWPFLAIALAVLFAASSLASLLPRGRARKRSLDVRLRNRLERPAPQVASLDPRGDAASD